MTHYHTPVHAQRPRGLQNLGNTCYMNACLQILAQTAPLNTLLDAKSAAIVAALDPAKPDGYLMHEWNLLRQVMQTAATTGSGDINPRRFITFVHHVARAKRAVFTGFDQNDVSEFLYFVLDCFHNTLRRPTPVTIGGIAHTDADKLAATCYRAMKETYEREYSEVYPLFYGMQLTQILPWPSRVDQQGPMSTSCPEFFSVLEVPIVAGGDLYDCLARYLTPEILRGDNAWTNSATGRKEDAVCKQTVIWSFPQILIVHLKRASGGGRKMRQHVAFPTRGLDLSRVVSGYQRDKYRYDLYGVCNHHGHAAVSGHYTAYVRGEDGQWWWCNDAAITAVSEAAVVTPNAACLFYRLL